MIFSPLFNLWNFRKITSFKIGNVPKVNRTPKNPYMYLSSAFLSKALLIVILKKCPGLCNHFIQIQTQYFHNNRTLHNFQNLPKQQLSKLALCQK